MKTFFIGRTQIAHFCVRLREITLTIAPKVLLALFRLPSLNCINLRTSYPVIKGVFTVVTILVLFGGAFYGVSLANTNQRVEPIEIDPVAVEGDNWTLVPEACLDDDKADDGTRQVTPCGFPQLVQFFANLMSLIIVLALAISTLLFAVAGFKYATSGGNMNQVKEATTIFRNVAIGLVVVFIAYTVVQVIVSALGVQATFSIFLRQP